jgi:hypothetical protein
MTGRPLGSGAKRRQRSEAQRYFDSKEPMSHPIASQLVAPRTTRVEP